MLNIKIRKNVKYNLENLIKYSQEKNFRLLKEYNESNINSDTIINGTCATEGCDNYFSKNYKRLITISGPYCKFCQIGRVVFDNNSLESYVKKNNIILLKDYTNIKICRDTKIEGKCLIDNCVNTFNKNYRYLVEEGGGYCDDCVQINKVTKFEETNIKKIGVKYPIQNKEIFNKLKKTNLSRYGVEHAPQNSIISEKQIINSFISKDYKLPSGKILKCQGYEPFALDKLIKEDGVGEEDIITSRIEVPEIWYCKQSNQDKLDNQDNQKLSRHYVDIFIPSQNFCIEVKSTWTFSKITEDILAKQKAGKELGYKYEIWIFDSKGKLINQIK